MSYQSLHFQFNWFQETWVNKEKTLLVVSDFQLPPLHQVRFWWEFFEVYNVYSVWCVWFVWCKTAFGSFLSFHMFPWIKRSYRSYRVNRFYRVDRFYGFVHILRIKKSANVSFLLWFTKRVHINFVNWVILKETQACLSYKSTFYLFTLLCLFEIIMFDFVSILPKLLSKSPSCWNLWWLNYYNLKSKSK